MKLYAVVEQYHVRKVRCKACMNILELRDYEETPEECEFCHSTIGECSRCNAKDAIVAQVPMHGTTENICESCLEAAIAAGDLVD